MSDLDDFFAKKGKKKSKSGKKASTPAETKEPVSTVQKEEEDKSSLFIKNTEDTEWKPENKVDIEVDIHDIQGIHNIDEPRNLEQQQIEQEELIAKEKASAKAGVSPWAVVPQVPKPQEASQKDVGSTPQPVASQGTYVAPNRRRPNNGTASKTNAVPDITSDDAFPSLGGLGKKESIPKAGHSAHSGRTVTTDIPLNNKFASLGTE